MPKCLVLAPFPLSLPRHGGQVRVASMLRAGEMVGWQMFPVGVFHAAFFPKEEWGADDIVVEDSALQKLALDDMAFADLHVARWTAADEGAKEKLRVLLRRIAPDIIQVEHPWTWLLLREVLPADNKIRIVYSSHNLEWAARKPLLKLSLQNASSEAMLEATRLLEERFARTADLVISISDVEGEEIARSSGRRVVHMPAVSDMSQDAPVSPRFAKEARSLSCRYAALMGSAYWPNVEGFFSLFPEGLGFLPRGEQLWIGGTLSKALREDDRFKIFESINESRSRILGYIDDSEKSGFLGSAECVIVPVQIGAGSKLKTVDAIVSGRPVVATSHAIEGYGAAVRPAIGNGLYIADTPKEFRSYIRQAMRGGLAGCSDAVRNSLRLGALSHVWNGEMRQLLSSGASST